MKDKYPEPQIGYWYTPYFRDQLRQIRDAADLKSIRREIGELAMDGIRARIYATRDEAEADAS